jgi:hypothetical protein
MRLILFLAMLLTLPEISTARNTPCSGSKGGISHCRGEKFVCNDKSTSASKKTCSGLPEEEDSKPSSGSDKSKKRQ